MRVRVRPWDKAPLPSDAFVSHQFAGLHPVELNFNNQWQLAALKFSEENGHLTLGLRWRCLQNFYGWLRCFAHVLNGSGRQITSMDHDLLDGHPAAAEWRPGDEGYEVRHVDLDGAQLHRVRLLLGTRGYQVGPEDAGVETPRLRLGLYETNTNLRLPLVASSLPVTDDYTAALVSTNTVPGVKCNFRFQPGPIVPCRVSFEGGVELWGCSVTKSCGVMWVRLGWSGSRMPKTPLRFFGHAVSKRDPQTETLISFDQELALERRGPAPEFVQDIVRSVPSEGSQLTFLRAGICTSQGLERAVIRGSSFYYDAKDRCFFVPLEA